MSASYVERGLFCLGAGLVFLLAGIVYLRILRKKPEQERDRVMNGTYGTPQIFIVAAVGLFIAGLYFLALKS